MSDAISPLAIGQEALAQARAQGEAGAICEALGQLGVAYYNEQDWENAISTLTDYLHASRELGNVWSEAVAHYYLGFSYQGQGLLSPAMEAFGESYDLFRQQNQNLLAKEVWQQLVNQGNGHFNAQQFDETLAVYQLQIKLLLKFDDIKAGTSVAIDVGKVRYYQGDFQGALACHLNVLEAAEGFNDQVMECLALAWVGCDYRELGDLERGLGFFERRLGVAQGLKDLAAQKETLGWLIDGANRLKQTEKAISFYEMQVALLQNLGDTSGEYSSRYDLAVLQSNSQQYQEALSVFESALKVAEGLEEGNEKSKNIANCQYMLGQCYHNLDHKEEAINHYRQAAGLYVELGVNDWAVTALGYIGSLCRSLKRYEEGIQAQEQRLGIVRELNERSSEQSCLYDLGCLFKDQEQWERGVEYFRLALGLAIELGEQYKQANAHYMLGSSYHNLDHKEEAINHYRQAVGLYVESGVKDWAAKALGYMGSLCRSLKRYEEEIQAQEQRLGFVRELNDQDSERSCLYDLGCLYNDLKEWERGVEYFGLALELAIELGEQYKQANAHYMLGQCFQNLKQVDKAVESYLQASSLYRETKTVEWIGNTLNKLGNIYRDKINGNESENIEQAISYYEAALEVYTREKCPEDWARVQINLGLAHVTQAELGINLAANLDKAISHYREATQIMRRLGLEKELAGTLNNLGIAHVTQAEFGINPAANLDKAISHLSEAAQIVHRLGLEKDLARTLMNLGVAQVTQAELGINLVANLDKAISHHSEAAQMLRCLGLEHDLASTLNNLGSAHADQAELGINLAANLDKAISHYSEAAQILRCLGLEKDLARTLNNLGIAHVTQAEFGINPAANLDKAISHHSEAAQILRCLGLEKDLASTLNNLGSTHVTQAEFGINPATNLDKAISHYSEAAQIRRLPGLEKDLASTLNNLGNAYANQAKFGINPAANLDKAISHYSEAAQIRCRLGLEKDLASTLNNLGSTHVTQAEFGINPAANLDKAISHYSEAAQIRCRLGLEKDLAATLTNLGLAHVTQAKFGINSTTNLDKAITHHSEAAQILRRLGLEKDLAATLTNLANAHVTQAEFGINPTPKLEQAIIHYSEATQIMHSLGLEKDLAGTLMNLGFAYQQESQHHKDDPDRKPTALNNAYRAFAEALEQVEYLRGSITTKDYKRNFNEEWNQLYRGIVKVSLELGNHTAAIEYVDRSKARNLAELMATKDLYPEGINLDTHQQLQALRQSMIVEDRRLQQDPNPDYTYFKKLRQEFQEKFPYKPLHFEQIQKLLDEETAMLEWYILPNQFLSFTLTNQTLNLWTSSNEDLKKLINWAYTYINDYRTNKTQWRETLADRLAELPKILHLDEILSNLFKNFPTCQKLILIPHRFLHLFPLHALPITTEDGKGYLQDLFPQGIAYAPNCQVLQQAQKRINDRPDFHQLFAIQNPTQDLPFTDIEVETIQTSFKPHHTLKHDQAQKTALDAETLKNAHCAHFSCHGYFNFENPLKSALILAQSEFTPPPQPDDTTRYLPLKKGKFLDLQKCLTLEDVLRLDLGNCRLVTLSACETGITDISSTTDEYIGLPSGFILAGSPNVISTLWTVDDLSTALLMIHFYQNLQQGQTVPLALRAAQNWLRSSTAQDLKNWSATISASLKKSVDEHLASRGPNRTPYSSPFYWAAFCAIGA